MLTYAFELALFSIRKLWFIWNLGLNEGKRANCLDFETDLNFDSLIFTALIF